MSLNVTCPINSLSFGNVAYNILRELYARGVSPDIFPIGNPDIGAFDKMSPTFRSWLDTCIRKAPENYRRDAMELRLWHISNSEMSHSNNQRLLTFWECNQLTPIEANILRNQEKVFVTSKSTRNLLRNENKLTNVEYVPLGFDAENYISNNKHPYNNQCVVWVIAGKWEPKRKKTDKLIKLWVKKFGNNPRHRLHLHCFNPFLDRDPARCAALNKQVVDNVLEGKRYWNINPIHAHLGTNTEYNNFINSGDIFLDGSGAEGWNLPAFHSTALGKHLVAVKANAVADWANDNNAVLVMPNGEEEVYDDIFFHRGAAFNQGTFPTWSEEEYSAAMDTALTRYEANAKNINGLLLQEEYTWKKTVDILLK